MRVSWILMPGILLAPAGDGQRHTLEHGEIDVDVQCRGLKGREAVGDGGQGAAHFVEVIKTLIEAEILEVVAQRLQAQEGGELLVHADHRVLGVGAQHMMAMFGLFQSAAQFALPALMLVASQRSG